MTDEETYTAEEVKAYGEEVVRQFSEQKSNVQSFFTKVIQNPETIRIGNVSEDELGTPHIPIRTFKELELFCDDVCKDNSWASYFKKMAEIQTSTSLSKEGFLLRLSVTQTKQLADVTQKHKRNKGWFHKKEKEGVD